MLTLHRPLLKRVAFWSCCLFLSAVVVYHFAIAVRAEQSGSSPESGTASRITSMASTVAGLSYGSTAAGSWGDYGSSLNRIFSAAQGAMNDVRVNGTKNGSGTGTIVGYTQTLGGVDDYNNNQTIPSNTYQKTWTTCNAGNSYCSTGDTNAEKQDPNTGLIWSARTSSSQTWFVANNCVAPGGAGSLGATCVNNGDPGCVCVKNASSKTGCEGLSGDSGGWRLPYQKELMLAYIDGSWSNLTNTNNTYWSSTTLSNNTQYAWYTNPA